MTYTVTALDAGKIELNVTETTKAVLQNVAVILATTKGTVPLYRDFGVDHSFLDLPIPAAKVRMIAQVREAVETWEPRATVTAVRFSDEAAAKGVLAPMVEVEINE